LPGRAPLAPAFSAARRPHPTDNKKETAMADNEWTLAEESMLVTACCGGIRPERIAEALRKTPGSVRWKLNRLGLTARGCGPAAIHKIYRDDQSIAVRRSDLAFQRAMLKAIKRSAERARPGVITSAAARYIPRVMPMVESGYRSSAGYVADMGQARHDP